MLCFWRRASFVVAETSSQLRLGLLGLGFWVDLCECLLKDRGEAFLKRCEDLIASLLLALWELNLLHMLLLTLSLFVLNSHRPQASYQAVNLSWMCCSLWCAGHFGELYFLFQCWTICCLLKIKRKKKASVCTEVSCSEVVWWEGRGSPNPSDLPQVRGRLLQHALPLNLWGLRFAGLKSTYEIYFVIFKRSRGVKVHTPT